MGLNVCVYNWGGWVGCGVLIEYEWIGTVSTILIGKRGRRESTSLYYTHYIQFIHEQITFHQPDKYD